VNSEHQHDKISDFKTDNSHWASGYYCMQGGLGVRNHSHEQAARKL